MNTTTASPINVTVVTSAPTGLVLALSFNERAGTVASDASGNGNIGTLVNTTWGMGRHGSGAVFNGTSSWVSVADAASLDLDDPLGVGEPDEFETDWPTTVLKERSPGLAYALYATDGASRPPAGYINVGGADVSVTSPALLQLNTWTHVAVTYDRTALRLYVNGALTATRSVTGNLVTSSGPLRIGGNAMWGEYFTGRIDEVRIYQRALTQAEVQNNMDVPIP